MLSTAGLLRLPGGLPDARPALNCRPGVPARELQQQCRRAIPCHASELYAAHKPTCAQARAPPLRQASSSARKSSMCVKGSMAHARRNRRLRSACRKRVARAYRFRRRRRIRLRPGHDAVRSMTTKSGKALAPAARHRPGARKPPRARSNTSRELRLLLVHCHNMRRLSVGSAARDRRVESRVHAGGRVVGARSSSLKRKGPDVFISPCRKRSRAARVRSARLRFNQVGD